MKDSNRRLLGSAFLAAVLTILSAGFAQGQLYNNFPDCSGNGNFGNTLVVIGLTAAPGQRLICFRENDPGNATTIGSVTGFVSPDTRLIGIDFRPSFGAQYGLGNFNGLYGVGNAGGIYVVNQQTGQLSFVNRVSVPLTGTFFGVDFNPAADLLRIVSDAGQNLRVSADPGGATNVDTPLNPYGGMEGAAYTNNDNNPGTGTLLYTISQTFDYLFIQNPPNAGTSVPVGPLNITTSGSIGFDIYSTENRYGVAANNRGFAQLTNPLLSTQTGFFAVNLNTGATSFRGLFDPSNVVIDIALLLRQERNPNMLPPGAFIF